MLLDPSDPAHKRLYVAGRAGLWGTKNAQDGTAIVWRPCMRHLNATVNRAIAADPNTPGRAYALDVDWTLIRTADHFNQVRQETISVGGSEEFSLAVDSTTNPATVGAVYVGRTNWLAYNADPFTKSWVDTGLPTTQKVKGCSAKKPDAATGTVVLAAVSESGIWRKVGAGSTGDWGSAPVLSSNNVMKGLNTPRTSFSWGGGASKMVYFTDKEHGVFRSMNAGADWVQITPPAGGWNGSGQWLDYCGSVAVDPTDEANCYVTQTGGVWFSADANATPQPVFTKISIPRMGMAKPGCVVFDDAGGVYINALVSDSTPARIFYKAKGSTDWQSIAQDAVFQSQCAFATDMSIGPGPEHRIYLSSDNCGICVGERVITGTGLPSRAFEQFR